MTLKLDTCDALNYSISRFVSTSVLRRASQAFFNNLYLIIEDFFYLGKPYSLDIEDFLCTYPLLITSLVRLIHKCCPHFDRTSFSSKETSFHNKTRHFFKSKIQMKLKFTRNVCYKYIVFSFNISPH